MATFTVSKIDKTKTGKDRVYLNGATSWKDAYYVGNRCNGVPPVGATIEIDSSSKRFDGASQDTWFINSWRLAVPAPQHKTVITGPASPTLERVIPTHEGWTIDAGDLTRFASNLIANAITAGIIKEPAQILPWAKSAYEAGEALRKGKFEAVDVVNGSYTEQGPDPTEDQGHPDFEDDIPF